MDPVPFVLDLASQSLNKRGEELCGDRVEVRRNERGLIIVLADGLGSGVKANILATLTTKIATTMLEQGESIEDTIDTIMDTLPVCQVRKIAYSTFGVIQIDKVGHCTIMEYDTPPFFLIRRGQLIQPECREITYSGKLVRFYGFDLQEGDALTLVSDGVIHAGMGNVLNHGWEWEHVGGFLERQSLKSADRINRRLIDNCNRLYGGLPGDDTTAVTVKVRVPENIHIFAGPPESPDRDAEFVSHFVRAAGKKIICGGTAATIVGRELHREIKTSLEYIDPDVPPTAVIEGIDLVTEGVMTLKKTMEMLERYQASQLEPDGFGNDGASRLAKLLINDCTHVYLWMGRAVNPAHQAPGFPIELSIKINVLHQLKQCLELLGRTVIVNYI